jgi:hypothetical protein
MRITFSLKVTMLALCSILRLRRGFQQEGQDPVRQIDQGVSHPRQENRSQRAAS